MQDLPTKQPAGQIAPIGLTPGHSSPVDRPGKREECPTKAVLWMRKTLWHTPCILTDRGGELSFLTVRRTRDGPRKWVRRGPPHFHHRSYRMSAFFSNQPDPDQAGPAADSTDHGDRPDPIVTRTVSDPDHPDMVFPEVDEAGEPIHLNAPPAEDDPTPEEIEARSQEIRGRWSDRVKKKRHLRAPMKWNVPSVPVADIEFPRQS